MRHPALHCIPAPHPVQCTASGALMSKILAKNFGQFFFLQSLSIVFNAIMCADQRFIVKIFGVSCLTSTFEIQVEKS